MFPHRFAAAVVLAALAVTEVSSHAVVLCRRRSGLLAVREACRKKETAVDPATIGLRGPEGPVGPQGPPGNDAGRLELLTPGSAATLEARRCYGIIAGGAAGEDERGNVLSGWLQDSGGQAIVPNLVFVVPGARNLTTDGGSVGSVILCNFRSGTVDLPSGWQLVTTALDAP